MEDGRWEMALISSKQKLGKQKAAISNTEKLKAES
jgi:hypothetical protein